MVIRMPRKDVRQPAREVAALAGQRSWGLLTPVAPLGDQLSHRISALIQEGEFGDEGKLPTEATLAERFGVSRPVIREALSRLRAMGLIVSRKGSGSYVCRRVAVPMQTSSALGFGPLNSLAQVRQLFHFRLTIEGDSAFYAAQHRTAELLEVMQGALTGMEEAIADGVVGMTADVQFHDAIAKATANDFYIIAMESLRAPIEFSINLTRSLAMTRPIEHLLTVQAEHVAIFKAIEARDKDAARTAMRTHVQNACRRLFEGPGENPQFSLEDNLDRFQADV